MNNSRNNIALLYGAGALITFCGFKVWDGVRSKRAFSKGHKFINKSNGIIANIQTENEAFYYGLKGNTFKTENDEMYILTEGNTINNLCKGLFFPITFSRWVLNKMSKKRFIWSYIYIAGAMTAIIGQYVYDGVQFSRAYRRGDAFVNKQTGEPIIFSSETEAVFAGINNNMASKVIYSVCWPSSVLVFGFLKANGY
jgi:hypothetical protein